MRKFIDKPVKPITFPIELLPAARSFCARVASCSTRSPWQPITRRYFAAYFAGCEMVESLCARVSIRLASLERLIRGDRDLLKLRSHSGRKSVPTLSPSAKPSLMPPFPLSIIACFIQKQVVELLSRPTSARCSSSVASGGSLMTGADMREDFAAAIQREMVMRGYGCKCDRQWRSLAVQAPT